MEEETDRDLARALGDEREKHERTCALMVEQVTRAERAEAALAQAQSELITRKAVTIIEAEKEIDRLTEELAQARQEQGALSAAFTILEGVRDEWRSAAISAREEARRWRSYLTSNDMVHAINLAHASLRHANPGCRCCACSANEIISLAFAESSVKRKEDA